MKKTDSPEKLRLTDLIEVEILQKMQDAFAKMTGMAALTTDENGAAITKGTNFSAFCTDYCRKSVVGIKMCEECDRKGALMALEKKGPVSYYCHAGLIDFAAPIILNGTMIGGFIGGQVLTQKPYREAMRKIAAEIDVDPEGFLKAAEETNIVEKETIQRATEAIYEVAEILTDMAYKAYVSLQLSMEAMQAASLKSDFLANTSHEIRTPMNAIVGMAQLALREQLPNTARDYLNQIVSSSQILLTIINDILDFSKIESGKMTIAEEVYSPVAMLRDIINIIVTRIGDKDVELLIDIEPTIPKELLGDSIRIQQIIVNLANNAVKFTRNGKVAISMHYQRKSKDEILLQCSVEDTGIGIKKEDYDKLFEAFQQLDSKRNRGVEGTGLGLVIAHNLLDLMNGRIYVESEYGMGSIFYFELPQKIITEEPSIDYHCDKEGVAAMISNSYVREQLRKDVERYGALFFEESSPEKIMQLSETGKLHFLFIERMAMTQEVEELLSRHPELTVVVLSSMQGMQNGMWDNFVQMKKPVHSANLVHIFQHEDIHMSASETSGDVISFIAPDAEILIVDDNAINLTVAEGLLEPLQMKIDRALSGKEAIDMISNKHYDIILMDHMMPELDGVETTRIIRRFHLEYDDVPIIALTANAIAGTQEKFIKEGMNDFIAKPIELQIMLDKLRKWLPAGKVVNIQTDNTGGSAANAALLSAGKEKAPAIVIEGLDTGYALGLLGSEKLFWAVLKDYYHAIPKKMERIEEYEKKEQWQEYTIEVHALKSASRQVGALKLSERAENLENAGNRNDSDMIHALTGELLLQCRYYQEILRPYFPEEDKTADQGKITKEALAEAFEKISEALEELDMDTAGEMVMKLAEYRYDGWQKELLKKMENAVEDMDVEQCEEIIETWENRLKE
ncbi:MAG: PocR ligand-binding domain-containing protein [Lachnospiraceae bacterium]|nr:PocR ligand-binding domain-containing protein [Lachnospiraceae bacterium]